MCLTNNTPQLQGAYGTTLIRLSNDQGTLKFLVPQLSEQAVQTECVEEQEEAKEEGEVEEEVAEEGEEILVFSEACTV